MRNGWMAGGSATVDVVGYCRYSYKYKLSRQVVLPAQRLHARSHSVAQLSGTPAELMHMLYCFVLHRSRLLHSSHD